MEIFTADRQISDPNDFPHHVSPFPLTGNLLVSNPATAVHSPDSIYHQSLPAQKLRPIRGNARSPSTSQANDLPSPTPPSVRVDVTVDELGFLGHQVMCEATACFEPPEEVEGGGAAVNGASGPYGVVAGASAGDGSGIDKGKPEACFEGGLSEDESGSFSDDDNTDSSTGVKESQSGKRKREEEEELQGFLQKLVMQLMEKQEQMHERLIELMESRERERILREEAWKQQERERMKRDEELRAQEISRSLSLISFIQNVMGYKIELPQSESLMMKSHMNNNERQEVGNVSFQNVLNAGRWPEAEVQALITIRGALEQKFRVRGSMSSAIWDEVSAAMQNIGYSRSAKKCREKWVNINKYFKKSLESGAKKRHQNSSGKTCSYFHELGILYKNGVISPGN